MQILNLRWNLNVKVREGITWCCRHALQIHRHSVQTDPQSLQSSAESDNLRKPVIIQQITHIKVKNYNRLHSSSSWNIYGQLSKILKEHDAVLVNANHNSDDLCIRSHQVRCVPLVSFSERIIHEIFPAFFIVLW